MNNYVEKMAIGGVALLLSAGIASAATVTATTGVQLTSFTHNLSVDGPMPPAGQELVGISWKVTIDGTTTATVTNNNGATTSGEIRRLEVDILAFLNSADPALNLWPITSPVVAQTSFVALGDPVIVVEAGETYVSAATPISSVRSGSVQAADFAAWLGVNPVFLDVDVVGEITSTLFGGNMSASQVTSASVKLEIDYEYQDITNVIPLPAAGWLLLSGVFGLGGLGWMRRRAA